MVLQDPAYVENGHQMLALGLQIVFLVLLTESVGSKNMPKWETLPKRFAGKVVSAPWQPAHFMGKQTGACGDEIGDINMLLFAG